MTEKEFIKQLCNAKKLEVSENDILIIESCLDDFIEDELIRRDINFEWGSCVSDFPPHRFYFGYGENEYFEMTEKELQTLIKDFSKTSTSFNDISQKVVNIIASLCEDNKKVYTSLYS